MNKLKSYRLSKAKVIIVDIATALFILLFSYAAISKLADFEKFSIQLGKSPVINAFAHETAIAVPVIELIICILLFVRKSQLLGLFAAFGLMVAFTTYIVIILNFSSYIPCSCGGILERFTWSQHLVFNTGYVVLGAVGILLFRVSNQNLSIKKGEAENPV